MLRWLRTIFGWRLVRDSGAWVYEENVITGERRATRIAGSGWQPIDAAWLHPARFPPITTKPPMPRKR